MIERPAKKSETTMPAILTCLSAVHAYVRKEATSKGMKKTVAFSLIWTHQLDSIPHIVLHG